MIEELKYKNFSIFRIFSSITHKIVLKIENVIHFFSLKCGHFTEDKTHNLCILKMKEIFYILNSIFHLILVFYLHDIFIHFHNFKNIKNIIKLLKLKK